MPPTTTAGTSAAVALIIPSPDEPIVRGLPEAVTR